MGEINIRVDNLLIWQIIIIVEIDFADTDEYQHRISVDLTLDSFENDIRLACKELVIGEIVQYIAVDSTFSHGFWNSS